MPVGARRVGIYTCLGPGTIDVDTDISNDGFYAYQRFNRSSPSPPPSIYSSFRRDIYNTPLAGHILHTTTIRFLQRPGVHHRHRLLDFPPSLCHPGAETVFPVSLANPHGNPARLLRKPR